MTEETFRCQEASSFDWNGFPKQYFYDFKGTWSTSKCSILLAFISSIWYEAFYNCKYDESSAIFEGLRALEILSFDFKKCTSKSKCYIFEIQSIIQVEIPLFL